jgi:hypothetical protein
MTSRLLGLLLVLGCAAGRGATAGPEAADDDYVLDAQGTAGCQRQANVTVHVNNRSSMDIEIAFGYYTPARVSRGFTQTTYSVPRYYLEGTAIRLQIARGGLQVGTPPPIATEPVVCNDATLLIGSQPQYSFFYGEGPLRRSGTGDEPEGEEQNAAVPARVDDQGVLRWTETGEEVALFGVNYTTPFAYAYRAHGYVGADRKRAIDADVMHLDRLGLDAYRIHVWDREVSDRDGNLVANDHLDLLDYLLARLADHGIKVILTPIAWWPTGYPEPDPGTNGFSDDYDKEEMTVSPEARRAQRNYLSKFVTHENPYTGFTYAEDSNVLALEIFNEPSHPAGPEETTRYIDEMAGALRDAGFTKPIFYNISQGYSDEHGRAVCRAQIDGVSHQWYPTGLVRNSTVGGNMLPNVDRYTIPYEDFAECRDKARMVYEFDAADVAGSYMYPAMARSFRAAGFQWATQFAYDPMAIAYANTEYQTHFLNLVYTPAKAVSFMIAGAAFRQLPRGVSYDAYPESAEFGSFRVSYAEDLSEMVADTVFLYSNSTTTVPPQPSQLRHVAGVGSSAVVTYGGSGAYFLDRLDDGVWRLEVYPDAVWVVDPFTRPSLAREAARVVWRTRPMRITLSDLGSGFSVEPVNEGNHDRPEVRAGAFDIRPGAYVLTRAGSTHPEWTPHTVVDGRQLGVFVAPPSSEAATAVVHAPPAELVAGQSFEVRAQVVSREAADSVALFARSVGVWGPMLRLMMEPTGPFEYQAPLPAERVRDGLLEYVVTVYQDGLAQTFPGNVAGDPGRWDFTGREFWQVPIVMPEAPILLFDGRRDLEHVLYPHPWDYVPFRTGVVSGSEPGRLALSAIVQDLSPAPHHFALRTFLPDGERTRLGDATSGAVLRIRARAGSRSTDRIQIALVERDGSTWGAVIELTDSWRDIVVPLTDLQPTALALLPRPYPQFLPYLMEITTNRDAPRVAQLDGLQFSTSADLFQGAALEGAHGFQIERVVLEHQR